jgi:hypothetical protein
MTGKGWTATGNYRAARIVRDDGQAEARRFYKSEGAAFSGWIVSSTSDSYSYSDPIPTKAEAIEALLRWDR